MLVQHKALCLVLQQYGRGRHSSPRQEYQSEDGGIEVLGEFHVYEAHRKLQWHLGQLQRQSKALRHVPTIHNRRRLAYLFIQKN